MTIRYRCTDTNLSNLFGHCEAQMHTLQIYRFTNHTFTFICALYFTRSRLFTAAAPPYTSPSSTVTTRCQLILPSLHTGGDTKLFRNNTLNPWCCFASRKRLSCCETNDRNECCRWLGLLEATALAAFWLYWVFCFGGFLVSILTD